MGLRAALVAAGLLCAGFPAALLVRGTIGAVLGIEAGVLAWAYTNKDKAARGLLRRSLVVHRSRLAAMAVIRRRLSRRDPLGHSMTFPLAPVLGGGALAAAAYALYKHFSSSPSESTIKEATAAYTTAGPRGERVFTRDAAQGILRSLPGMGYSHPDPRGLPPCGDPPGEGRHASRSELSAANWVRAQNRRMSVLAPVYLPMPTGAPRYLRLAPPGHEAELAPYGYAVLAYADAYHRPSPGQPITGRPPIRRASPRRCRRRSVQRTRRLRRRFTIHSLMYSRSQSSHPKGERSQVIWHVRENRRQRRWLDQDQQRNDAGSTWQTGHSSRIGRRDHAVGWVAPVTAVQTLLRSFGATGHDNKPLVVDGKLGPDTRAAIKLFKRMHHLPEDDVVDGATFAALTLALGQRDDKRQPARNFITLS